MKHSSAIPGRVQYEDFALELDLSLDASVYDWIANTFNGKPQRRDGSIVAVDTQFKARSEIQFFQALLTEVRQLRSEARPVGSWHPSQLVL